MILTENGEIVSTDLLIIGGGMAGLIAALKATENSTDILVVEKTTARSAERAAATNGLAWALHPGENPEEWVGNQVIKGDYLNDQEWVFDLAGSSYSAILELAGWGLPVSEDDRARNGFENPARLADGNLAFIFQYVKMMAALREQAQAKGVRIFHQIQITDLVVDSGRVTGAAGFHLKDGRLYIFQSRAVILASGSCDFGLGSPSGSGSGEGIAAAYRAGAEIRNAEFGNLYGLKFKENGSYLQSNLAGYLVNNRGEKLAPRYLGEDGGDLSGLVQGVLKEEIAGRGPVYLDFSLIPSDFHEFLRVLGDPPLKIDQLSLKHEVSVAFRGKMSPIKVDVEFQTNIPGLWAVGDACLLGSAWGGALPEGEAGLSVTFAVYSGLRAGYSASAFATFTPRGVIRPEAAQALQKSIFAPLEMKKGVHPAEVILEIQEVVSPVQYNLVRHKKRLEEGLARLGKIQSRINLLQAGDSGELSKCHEAAGMLVCAEMLFRAALLRDESRGSQIREDFPARDDRNWLKWIIIRKEGAKMTLSTQPVPFAQYRFQPESGIHPWFRDVGADDFSRALAKGFPKINTQPVPVNIPPGEEVRTDVSMVSFSGLDDQRVSLAEFQGSVLILVAGGRDAVAESAKWVRELSGAFAVNNQVKLFQLAVVKAPPLVPKKIIAAQLRKIYGTSELLIDWDGGQNLVFELDNNGIPHLFLIDPQGFLLLRLVERYNEQAWKRLMKQMEKF